jgi:Tfp pilus assembly protein PilE
MVTLIIAAVLTLIAIPSLGAIVKSSQTDSAVQALTNIAQISYTKSTAANEAVPSASDVASAISAEGVFTSQPSTEVAAAPSTAYKDISYDTTDASSSTTPTIGLAMQSQGGACAYATVSTSGVIEWSTPTDTNCSGYTALAGQ